PDLERVNLVDFRAYIARVREGPRGNIAVRITASTPEGPPWTTVGSARDLLHAAWIALTDTLELAVLNNAGAAAASGDLPPARRRR
ncbi:MAG: citramalate synthase, partial [Geminicoccaceae bacterium]